MMMESVMKYDLPNGVMPDIPENCCYTVEDLQIILMCGSATVYYLLKRNEF